LPERRAIGQPTAIFQATQAESASLRCVTLTFQNYIFRLRGPTARYGGDMLREERLHRRWSCRTPIV